jgi:hypothetical protein
MTGFVVELQAPLAVLVAVPILVNEVLPHSIASTVTLSPAAPLETTPDSVTDWPYATVGGAAVSETPVRTTIVPRRFVLRASRYPKLPDFVKVYE